MGFGGFGKGLGVGAGTGGIGSGLGFGGCGRGLGFGAGGFGNGLGFGVGTGGTGRGLFEPLELLILSLSFGFRVSDFLRRYLWMMVWILEFTPPFYTIRVPTFATSCSLPNVAEIRSFELLSDGKFQYRADVSKEHQSRQYSALPTSLFRA